MLLLVLTVLTAFVAGYWTRKMTTPLLQIQVSGLQQSLRI